MKKFNLNILMVLVLIICINVFTGCTKEAEAQVFSSKRFKNFGDTTLLSPPLADYGNVTISLSDSSNGMIDTFYVYIVSPHGDEVLARMTLANDTTSVGYGRSQHIGVVYPGDGTTGIYSINAKNVFKIKVRRSNVATMNDTVRLSKVSYVSISGWKTSGWLSPYKSNSKYPVFWNGEISMLERKRAEISMLERKREYY